MPTPHKHDILERAKNIALERQIRSGLPAITPSELELKETGAFQEAKLDLMRVDQEALSQQRHYLEEMAGELRLKIIPRKGLSLLKRETGYEWTNGWTKRETKPKRKRKPKQKVKVKPQKREKVKPTIKQLMKGTVLSGYVEAARVKQLPKLVKPKKRKKRHVERSGLTMRALRKVKGVNVFAFPDDVWRVRKPRKKRRRK